MSTRKFFNTEFIKKNKLSFSTIIILQDIYFWILSKSPPKSFITNDTTYYYISQTHFAEYNDGLLSQPRINKIFNELKDIGIIDNSIIINYHMNYISLNWDKIEESVLSEEALKEIESNEWWKRIHKYAREQKAMKKNKGKNPKDLLNQGYEIVMKNGRNFLVKKKEFYIEDDSMLLTKEDMGIKNKYCKEADSIARKLIKRYNIYFSHRLPDIGTKPTKLYENICIKITDIYNGNFLKSRIYPLSIKFLNNSQFNTENWKDKIKECKGDWVKVKKLIFEAMKNFVLMHEKNRMPYNKNYLQTNLSLWFYDDVSNRDEPQSQFVLCLNEPEYTTKHHSELKADKIFESLNNTAKKGGNKLFDLNENMPSGLFWQRVKEMVEWGKLAFKFESNIQYWITSPSEIPEKFAEYCKMKKISVSVHTLDIEKAVEDNSPWTWFIKDMSIKHGLNSHLSECVTKEDFSKNYKITIDDLEDVIF